MKDKYLLLIDGSSLLTTQYYGNLPKEILFAKTDEEKEKYYDKIMKTRKGVYTNAVFGFMRTLIKIVKEQSPAYIAVAWDKSRNTFRREMYADYKGNRGATPEPLKAQFELCEQVLERIGIPQFMDDRYEADDFCGTLAAKFESSLPVRIFTKDNDYLQLVTENTNLWIMHSTQKKTEELYKKYNMVPDGTVPERAFFLTPELVEKEFGVKPSSVNSLKGLQGDSSDNIKGVPGVGPATAVALIAKYETVEALYDDIRGLDEAGKKEKAAIWKSELGISRSPLNYLLKESDEELVGEKAAMLSKKLATIKRDVPVEVSLDDLKLNINTDEAAVAFAELEFKSLEFSTSKKEELHEERELLTISDINELENFCETLKKKPGVVGISVAAPEKGDADFDALPGKSQLYGLFFTLEKENRYVPVEGFVSAQLLSDKLVELDEAGVKFTCVNLKRLYRMADIKELKNAFDVCVAAYLISPLDGDYLYNSLSKLYLNRFTASREDFIGKLSFGKAYAESRDNALKLITAESETAFACLPILTDLLEKTGMLDLYNRIEHPLIKVLNDMEKRGILVVKEALSEYGDRLQLDIDRLEHEIYDICGEEFNINSPKQLGVILFEKLKLPYGKKTKTGYSTSAEVLEKLKIEDPVVEKILDYRQLTKLKSTYADGLNDYIDSDGRIRTTFNQTVTATGRLSSTEPNLQNIPVRVELGRELRKVFVPKEGCVFVDADYSQIELRILAALSGDEKLIGAYKNSEDIHASTAAAVFKVAPENVTKELRSRAKAVNFGIVYGISSFGLGTGLNISKKEAEQYIESYFETYPGVKEYLDNAVRLAKENSFSTTLFGRRRPIPELESTNFMQRSFGERVAMNSPVQGTAADIIKVAMLHVFERLEKEGLKSRMLLQIHDELLVEAYEDEAEKVKIILSEEMKNAVDLAVGLEVGLESGYSWLEAH